MLVCGFNVIINYSLKKHISIEDKNIGKTKLLIIEKSIFRKLLNINTINETFKSSILVKLGDIQYTYSLRALAPAEVVGGGGGEERVGARSTG